MDQDVLRLQVAVNNPLVVQVRQPLQQLRVRRLDCTHLAEEVETDGERRHVLVQYVAQGSVAAVLHLDVQ